MTPRVAPVLLVSGLLLVAGAGQWLLRGASVGAAMVAEAKGAAGPGGAPVPGVPVGVPPTGSEAPGGTLGAARETRALPGPTERGRATVPAVAELAPMPASHAEAHQPRVATGLIDYHGNETTVACATCHATREPDRDNGIGGAVPKAFHQGLVYTHGGQSCLSCHHSEDYDALRLTDGRKLAFADSQQLCAQCHGPQTRDYLHGSHGGMTGYWDKAKGPRTRNACLDCHDPHAPAYPAWTPVFPPRDGAARQQAEREAVDSHPHE